MKHECEHRGEKDGFGACRSCLEPMRPRPSRFMGSQKPWGIEFRGHLIKSYVSLNKVLVETAEMLWEDYMLIAPNGMRLSIEAGRMI